MSRLHPSRPAAQVATVRGMLLPRVRQVVLAAADLDQVTAEIDREVAVGSPFRDEGVGHFGLRNAVYSLGDSFLEVVSPIRADTAVGRHLERCDGDSGYMLMFEVADATATRDRLERLGVRIGWGTTHPDIVDLHLHPKDVGGALVALDITDPVGSWRWGGEAWTAIAPTPAAGGCARPRPGGGGGGAPCRGPPPTRKSPPGGGPGSGPSRSRGTRRSRSRTDG